MANKEADEKEVSGYLTDPFVEDIGQHFTNIELLSSEDFTQLYKAMRYGRWYVLKTITDDTDGSCSNCQMLLHKELELLMRMQHAGVVQAIGLEDIDGIGEAIIMEYVDGSTLDEWLTTGPDKKKRIRVAGELAEALAYLGQVLVAEGLVDAHVAGAPGKMGGGRGFLSGTGAAGDGVHGHIVVQLAHLCQRQQTQLYAGGETAGVGDVAGRGDAVAVQLGQAVDEVVAAVGDAEVLGQVYHAECLGQRMLLEEGAALAVAEAEEEHVDVVEGHVGAEGEVQVAVKAFVHVGHGVPGMAFAVGEPDFGHRVTGEHAEQLAAGIASGTHNAYSNGSVHGGVAFIVFRRGGYRSTLSGGCSSV